MDPDHLPGEIQLIEHFGAQRPEIPQFACFDTAFHHKLPRVAQIVAIPRRFESSGVRRYGFHGLSYASLMAALTRTVGPEVARGRVILAHLGSGASMAAVRDGQSIDTTMALTPAAGLVMGTRSGDIDPGLPGFLARAQGVMPSQFDSMINHDSGLLGVSETSPDIRDLLAQQDKDIRAAEAVALFAYRRRRKSGRWPPHWVDLMSWCSRAASARIPPRFAPGSAKDSSIWGSSWTRRVTRPMAR